MSVSRRTAMSILGVGTAIPALAAEDFLQSVESGRKTGIADLPVGNDAKRETIAKALRNLADAIEKRDVEPHGITITTYIRANEIVMQRLHVDFVIPLTA